MNLYDATVPVFTKCLKNIDTWLDKAVAYADQKKFDPEILMNARLAPEFAPGQSRAQGVGRAAAYVDRAEATLPADIRARITRNRRAGEDEAAIDPLTEPDVRAAIARASFELLVGFQLTEEQLAYNATR